MIAVMEIRKATSEDAGIVAVLVSESNKEVASKFGLTFDNCPKHPSLCNEKWIKADLDRGEQYFILEEASTAIGCVAYERPDDDVVYLNRLSVLPPYRARGFGAKLVQYIIQLSRSTSAKTISIGIIGEHIELRDWYTNLGFKSGELKRFPHLPFTVQYMAYNIETEDAIQEINLIVTIDVLPGKRSLQIDAYQKLKPLVLAEPGCLQYELFGDTEDKNKFILFEKWDSQAALDAHDQTKHMIEADAYSPTFRSKPASVTKMKPVIA